MAQKNYLPARENFSEFRPPLYRNAQKRCRKSEFSGPGFVFLPKIAFFYPRSAILHGSRAHPRDDGRKFGFFAPRLHRRPTSAMPATTPRHPSHKPPRQKSRRCADRISCSAAPCIGAYEPATYSLFGPAGGSAPSDTQMTSHPLCAPPVIINPAIVRSSIVLRRLSPCSSS